MMHGRLPALTAWPGMGRGTGSGPFDHQVLDRQPSPIRRACPGVYGQ